jgi:hypothetical protein
MADKQPESLRRRKPPLTTTRFRRMVLDLVHLSRKYGDDLEEVVPSASRLISEANRRLHRLGPAPKAGTPELWFQGQLTRLWIWVRVLQIEDSNLTDCAACSRLARDGYYVWNHDVNSMKGEDVRVRVTNSGTLRRRLADAKKSLRGHDDAICELEQRAQDLVQDRRIESLLISEALSELPNITLQELEDWLIVRESGVIYDKCSPSAPMAQICGCDLRRIWLSS